MQKANNWIHHEIIFTSLESRQLLINSIQHLNFSGLEESDSGFVIYYQDPTIQQQIKMLCSLLLLDCTHSININKAANWNAIWESSFQPVRIEKLCIIYAKFHKVDLSAYEYNIQITPQMSFGTGHHETTRLMISQMASMELKNKTVFDFGSGTGILAILAEMMGAQNICGIDNMPWAVENAEENAERNGSKRCTFLCANHARLPGQKFDVIFVNIVRKVILDNMDHLMHQINKNGYLLISGFLRNDAQKMIFETTRRGFKLIRASTENKWVCQLYQKTQ